MGISHEGSGSREVERNDKGTSPVEKTIEALESELMQFTQIKMSNQKRQKHSPNQRFLSSRNKTQLNAIIENEAAHTRVVSGILTLNTSSPLGFLQTSNNHNSS